ncbi:GNAT family N-acetyltransferase [Sphingomonas sp.]|uniref:GNAT family N-acetyltransferase n=1 Tax=Sphingomonas sp. TaxID=28214 RepID=UPI002DD66CBE|nr:GNAT family N-acetyltransferase [Sphingomonas sp.]
MNHPAGQLQPGVEIDLIVHASPTDPDARPLVDDLIREYSARYHDVFEEPDAAAQELDRYPPADFAAPHGAFLLIRRGGETIGGGAFMRHADPGTAEFKRIWTDPRHRRRGLARRIVEALEVEARRLGYRRVYLTTGFRQPEAVGLYRRLGYTALFDPDGDLAAIFKLPFEKALA